MQRKRKSIILLVALSVFLYSLSAVPAFAAGSMTSVDGREVQFNDNCLAWNYAVYLAKTTGREVTFKLNGDFTAYTSDKSVYYNGQKYKFKKYDFGVNVREVDLGVGLSSQNAVNAFRYGSLLVPSGAKIILDLNGYMLDRKESKQRDDGEVIHIEKGGVLTVIDSNPRSDHSAFSGGAITGGASEDGAGGIHVYGVLNFKAGTIYNCNTCEHGGGLYIADSGELNMTGGRILRCVTKSSSDDCNGGAIYVNGGKCNLSGCKIDGCESEDNGGALYMKKGRLVCNDVVFADNRAKDEGGAVYIWEGNSTFTDCSFARNSTKGDRGGAVFINTGSNYKSLFEECWLFENAGGEGGAVFIDDGQVDMVNTRFSDNYSNDDGGAIFVNSSDGVYLFDCVYINNRCEDEGGAIFIDNKKCVISGAEITRNRSVNHGGAIYVDSDYDLNIQGYCVIKNNESQKKHTNNIALEKSSSHTAYMYAGSIEEGSEIHIASTNSGEQPVTKNSNLSQYQFSHYFVADGSNAKLKNVETKTVKFVSSAFLEDTNLIVIIIGVAVFAGVSGYSLFIAKKKRRTDNAQ